MLSALSSYSSDPFTHCATHFNNNKLTYSLKDHINTNQTTSNRRKRENDEEEDVKSHISVLTVELTSAKRIKVEEEIKTISLIYSNELTLQNPYSASQSPPSGSKIARHRSGSLSTQEIYDYTFGSSHINQPHNIGNNPFSVNSNAINIARLNTLLNSPHNSELNHFFDSIQQDKRQYSTQIQSLQPNIHSSLVTQEFLNEIQVDANDIIANAAVLNLFSMLNFPNIHGLCCFSLYWKFNCKYLGIIQREEFVTALSSLEYTNLNQLQAYFQQTIGKELRNKTQFKQFYQYLYTALRNVQLTNKKTIPINIAIELLESILLPIFPAHMGNLLEFLEEQMSSRALQRITLDQWLNILEWCESIEAFSLAGYEYEASWPILFDEYVEWCKVHYAHHLHPDILHPESSSKESNPKSPKALIDAFNEINMSNLDNNNADHARSNNRSQKELNFPASSTESSSNTENPLLAASGLNALLTCNLSNVRPLDAEDEEEQRFNNSPPYYTLQNNNDPSLSASFLSFDKNFTDPQSSSNGSINLDNSITVHRSSSHQMTD
jgi:hypothetical protein